MAAVDYATGVYLKSPAKFTKATSGSAGLWGDRAVDSEIISPLATKAAADTEAARQIAFLAGPNVDDMVVVKGQRKDLMGKVITAKGNFLDYDAGVACLVIGYNENEAGYTELSVLRRLQ